ncbi:putative bifunctional diguanylate cyclase/phosphodiesterase [Deinococcus seoulensis]|uniref:putative bifunctional diguanylate cyclase/phosphodiesterase n=1 Tax=Deinococcus seoulensis TaxID=1837379 RepID=UPI00166C0254|nr:GGDEF domain-containing protein [Deinococcus seoulensis]
MLLARSTAAVPPSFDLVGDEGGRLRALYETGLLDSAPEAQFDRIVRLVARHFGKPTALISLVDRERQWFKARVGCDVSETPRDNHSICSLAIEQSGVLVIPDATADPRVRDFETVTGSLNVRFYAGAPLITPEGFKLGTLCLLDTQPGTFSADDVLALQEFAALVMDEIALRRTVHELDRLALNDPLTGLPNRTHFRQHLTHAMRRASQRSERVTLCLLDLNGFKLINDSLGHAAGDALLQEVAQRLQGCVSTGDLVARMGSDEFTIVLNDVRSAQDTDVVLRRIEDALRRPFMVAGQELWMNWSAGLSIYPEDSRDPERLLSQADAAMNRAKQAGYSYAYFNVAHDRRNPHDIEKTAALHHAIERGELQVYYQPVVTASDHRLIGHEALVRWNRPGGMVSPAEFIPLAEATGQILNIGAFVLRQAALDAHTRRIGRVSVNVSAREFEQPGYAEQVRAVLEETGVDPDLLVLEITESSLLNAERAGAVLNDLRSLGVRLALDDFGTGYSSLGAMSSLPVQILKIDRSFTRDLGREGPAGTRALEVIRAIVTLAGAMEVLTVAEGVETPLQAALLREVRCTFLQGFLFGRPAPLPALD